MPDGSNYIIDIAPHRQREIDNNAEIIRQLAVTERDGGLRSFMKGVLGTITGLLSPNMLSKTVSDYGMKMDSQADIFDYINQIQYLSLGSAIVQPLTQDDGLLQLFPKKLVDPRLKKLAWSRRIYHTSLARPMGEHGRMQGLQMEEFNGEVAMQMYGIDVQIDGNTLMFEDGRIAAGMWLEALERSVIETYKLLVATALSESNKGAYYSKGEFYQKQYSDLLDMYDRSRRLTFLLNTDERGLHVLWQQWVLERRNAGAAVADAIIADIDVLNKLLMRNTELMQTQTSGTKLLPKLEALAQGRKPFTYFNGLEVYMLEKIVTTGGILPMLDRPFCYVEHFVLNPSLQSTGLYRSVQASARVVNAKTGAMEVADIVKMLKGSRRWDDNGKARKPNDIVGGATLKASNLANLDDWSFWTTKNGDKRVASLYGEIADIDIDHWLKVAAANAGTLREALGPEKYHEFHAALLQWTTLLREWNADLSTETVFNAVDEWFASLAPSPANTSNRVNGGGCYDGGVNAQSNSFGTVDIKNNTATTSAGGSSVSKTYKDLPVGAIPGTLTVSHVEYLANKLKGYRDDDAFKTETGYNADMVREAAAIVKTLKFGFQQLEAFFPSNAAMSTHHAAPYFERPNTTQTTIDSLINPPTFALFAGKWKRNASALQAELDGAIAAANNTLKKTYNATAGPDVVTAVNAVVGATAQTTEARFAGQIFFRYAFGLLFPKPTKAAIEAIIKALEKEDIKEDMSIATPTDEAKFLDKVARLADDKSLDVHRADRSQSSSTSANGGSIRRSGEAVQALTVALADHRKLFNEAKASADASSTSGKGYKWNDAAAGSAPIRLPFAVTWDVVKSMYNAIFNSTTTDKEFHFVPADPHVPTVPITFSTWQKIFNDNADDDVLKAHHYNPDSAYRHMPANAHGFKAYSSYFHYSSKSGNAPSAPSSSSSSDTQPIGNLGRRFDKPLSEASGGSGSAGTVGDNGKYNPYARSIHKVRHSLHSDIVNIADPKSPFLAKFNDAGTFDPIHALLARIQMCSHYDDSKTSWEHWASDSVNIAFPLAVICVRGVNLVGSAIHAVRSGGETCELAVAPLVNPREAGSYVGFTKQGIEFRAAAFITKHVNNWSFPAAAVTRYESGWGLEPRKASPVLNNDWSLWNDETGHVLPIVIPQNKQHEIKSPFMPGGRLGISSNPDHNAVWSYPGVEYTKRLWNFDPTITKFQKHNFDALVRTLAVDQPFPLHSWQTLVERVDAVSGQWTVTDEPQGSLPRHAYRQIRDVFSGNFAVKN